MRLFPVAMLAAALIGGPVLADDTPDYVSGPWHYRSVSCVDTTVTSVTPRLVGGDQTHFTPADFQASGVSVEFATGLGIRPLDPSGRAGVTHYQDTVGNNVMMREHAGDKVQVCFLGGPPPTKYCNPDKDLRGRNYRVWDYRQQRQYAGMNSEHDCGGA